LWLVLISGTHSGTGFFPVGSSNYNQQVSNSAKTFLTLSMFVFIVACGDEVHQEAGEKTVAAQPAAKSDAPSGEGGSIG
jgi:hypothetical protein